MLHCNKSLDGLCCSAYIQGRSEVLPNHQERNTMIKFDEFQSFNKDGIDAFIASATAWTKGLQAIALESADYSRKAFEKNAQAVEKVLGAKSLDKAVEFQQGFAK